MRRNDREITDINEKIKLIEQNKVCRIGFSDNGQPYIVPMNYGFTFESGVLVIYLHCAKEGRKIDILKNNNKVCFEIDDDHRLVDGGEIACKYGYSYSSIIGFGKIELINEPGEKTQILNILMKHQTGKDTVYSYTEKELDGVTTLKIIVDDFSGKRRVHPSAIS